MKFFLFQGVNCSYCGEQFNSIITRNRHENICSSQSHHCRYCQAILASKRLLNNHEVRCRKRFHNIAQKRHTDRERELQAKLDAVQLEQAQEDEHHDIMTQSQHDSQNDCTKCGSSHSDARTFKCRHCSKQFETIRAYQSHRQTHFQKKAPKLVCNICEKTCDTGKDLYFHQQKEHNIHNSSSPKNTYKCCDCNAVFDAHYKLHSHRMSHAHAHSTSSRIDNMTLKMPWEKDPSINPPWITIDKDGNSLSDTAFRLIYSENRDTIQAPHDVGIIRGLYNFPVDDFNNDSVKMRSHLDHILKFESHAFKLNVAFGMLLRHIETGEYRYYTPYYNNTILQHPFRINRSSDINELMTELEKSTSIDNLLKNRESTKWQLIYVTNITYFVYRMGYLIGSPVQRKKGSTLPVYIRDSKSIISLDSSQHNRMLYKDKLCAFRCLAWNTSGRKSLEKQTKTYYNQWRFYQQEQGDLDLPANSRRFKGIYFQDLPDFEKCFNVRISVYSLHADNSCSRVYQSSFPSDQVTDSEMYLNLYNHHFSLIVNFSSYAKKYACIFCARIFDQPHNLSRHQKGCCSRVRYKFSGGIYSPSLSIFDEIQQTLGVVVQPELQLYPWFAVYDFESVLKPTEQKQTSNDTSNIQDSTIWTTSHIPVAVSIASNVDGYIEPRCIVEDDPENLVQKMTEYLEEIQCKTSELAKEHWSYLRAKLQEKKNEFPTDTVTKESMDCHNVFMQENENKEQHIQIAAEQDEVIIGGMDHQTARDLHACKVDNLIHRFEKYMNVLPVLGFNSSKYDLNLIKKYFPKYFNLATDCDYVVKKTNQYTAIATSKFKFLDILNYLAAGCNYSKFLKAYDIEESKSYFPYEWFDDVEKLKFNSLPPYETFFSKLKNANVLEIEHAEWEIKGRIGHEPETGHSKYKELQKIWENKGMQTFEHFLHHYANLDTGPFVKAAEKLQKYYFQMEVDVFKVAISAPGVARRLLFKHAISNGKYFSSFGPDHEDLFYKIKKCAIGGPSIIFKRYAKVGESLIRGNSDKVCSNIVGFDCNGLYLFALGEELPVLFPIRRLEENKFKPEVSWRHLEMYQWMNWLIASEGHHIQHKLNSGKEFPVGPYLLDGFSHSQGGSINIQKSRGYEFYGCWTHGHDPSVCRFNRDYEGNPKFNVSEETRKSQEKKRKYTSERESYIRGRNIDLTVIYECEFAQMKKQNRDVKKHSATMFPQFYSRYPRSVSLDTILQNVESGELTGFLQVDIKVPEKWPKGKERDVSPYEYFSEMSPIFCNSEVHFNEWGETMQNYSLSHMASDFTDSKKLLIGGMSAEKIFLESNLLKWYMEKGLEITRVYEVVEYRYEKCFEGFCDYISTARREGDQDPSKEILGETCKVLGNASYGSLLLDKTKHTNVKYVHDSHQAHLAVNDPSFISCCSLPGELYEIEKSKQKIDLDIPIQLAFTILQTAKLKLLQFYYDCLDYYVNREDYEITHADTDSLYFMMSADEFEKIVKPEKLKEFKQAIYGNCYDVDSEGKPFRASTVNWFPRECCEKHRKHDKRERGLFKKEASGTELIALASKTYHLSRPDAPDSVKAKGINKSALVDPYKMYINALVHRIPGSAQNMGFRAVDNSIMTYIQNRRGFNFMYVKRKILENGIDTEPLCITMNPFEEYNVFVLDGKKHCLSNEYKCFMQKHGHVFISCSHLFSYEMAVYNDYPILAQDILIAQNEKKIAALSRQIKLKVSWYTDRDQIMHDILWQKINQMKKRVILELSKCRNKLIVHPGNRSNGYFTCGILNKMAEITNPAHFPGTDMLSIFWEQLSEDDNFMNQ